MEQGSNEWLEFRRQGVGSSDAPVVMGVSPYSNLHELWLDKKGLKQDEPVNGFVMKLGQEFEPKARARFELETDIEVEPVCLIHSEHNWLRASLDAASIEHGVFAEIKYMGQKNFDLVKSGVVLKHHWPQIQHQFLVSGFKRGFYVVYTLTEDKKNISNYFCLSVEPDPVYITSLLYPALRTFWTMVENNEEPAKPEIKKRKLKVK